MSLSQEDINNLIDLKLVEQEGKFKKSLHEQEERHKQEIKDLENKLNKKINLQLNEYKAQLKKNDELVQRVVTLERDIILLSKDLEVTSKVAFSSDQYVRRNNIEFSGIPHECDDNLEEVCISLVNSILNEPGKPDYDDDDDIGPFDIEGCHRLRSENKDGIKNTIIRFTNRKVSESLMKHKKRLNL